MAMISQGNSKLGDMPNISVPVSVCNPNLPCRTNCYARKGNFTYTNVKNGFEANLLEFKTNPEQYFNSIIDYLDNESVIYKYFRWHTSGDIVNMNYLIGMVQVAEACPQTKFLAYTKKFRLVNMYLSVHKTLPSNLTIVFSGWDKDFQVSNPYNLPVTYINFTTKKMQGKNANFQEDAKRCPGDCRHCKMCWHLQAGETLVFNQH